MKISYLKYLFLLFLFSVNITCTSQNEIPNSSKELEQHLDRIKKPLDRILFLKKVSKESDKDSIKATAYYKILRTYYVELKEMDSSLLYINTLEKEYSAKKLPELFYKAILYKGKIYDFLNQPEKALNYYEKALKITDINNNYKGKLYVYNSLAKLNRKQSDTIKALKYYHKAIYNGIVAKQNLRGTYNNIGVLHINKNKDSAIYYFKKCLDIAIKNENETKIADAYINLSHTFLRKNDGRDFLQILKYLKKAEVIADKLKIKDAHYYVYFYYGLYYQKTNNNKLAEKYYQITLESPERLTDPVQHIKVLNQVSQFYEKNGRFDDALKINKQYHYLKDSIYSVEKNTAFNNIKTKYEVEKKDQNIALLQKENDLADTKRKWIITSSVFISLGLIGLFLFYRHRARNQEVLRIQEQALFNTEKDSLQKSKELAEIKALVIGRDKERNRIATELHDGVGGKLGGIHMALSTINIDLKNRRLAKISGFVKESLEEIRSLSHGLSSNYVTDRSLKELITDLKRDLEEKHIISIELSFFPLQEFKDLNKELKHHIYRITQELCNNTLKHAHASHISLSINKHEDQISFLYEDNGKGFDISTHKQGIGLSNIKERTNLINASLNLDSFPGRGTHLTIEIPLS